MIVNNKPIVEDISPNSEPLVETKNSMDSPSVETYSLFERLPEGAREQLIAALGQANVAAGKIIFREGERGDSIVIILDGEAEVIKAIGTDDERLMRVLGAGAIAGEMSLFQRNGRRTATLRARTPVTLLWMSLDEFKELMQQHPALAFEMTRVVSLRLWSSENATITDLREKNRQLEQIRQELQQTNVLLEDYNRSLEQAVAERTADLARASQDAQEARRVAERASQVKSAFLANMSHELRTPLNAIIGFTRIVRRKGEEVLPAKQLDNLDKVVISAEHLLDLINTILDIAKVESGRTDVTPVQFDVTGLLELCIAMAQPLLKPGVQVRSEIDPGLPPVNSDPEKVKRIVLNLLSNAAKFTQQGEITLRVRRDGDVLAMDVSDTGIGIAADKLETVFEEFQQADSSTTREYGGTGLGLTISRKLARLLGGDLVVSSELGIGSTFTLTIPVDTIDSVTGARAAQDGLVTDGDAANGFG